MKKKTPPVLRDSDFSFDDTATVMLSTHDHLFQLALFLNEAYLLQLARIEDLFIGDLPHPCFFYYNEEARLVYILIARPLQPEADPAFTDYNTMLLIRGREAWKVQQEIYDDVRNRRYGTAIGSAIEPDKTDLLEHKHWEKCNLLADSIQNIDIFGFGSLKGLVSTLRLTDDAPTLFPVDPASTTSNENRAIARYHKTLQNFLDQTFLALQVHLCEEVEL